MTISPFYGWNREKSAKPWARNGSAARTLSILALFVLFVIVAGCLPPLEEEEQYDDSCLRALGGGAAVDVTQLNEAAFIYTIFTALPPGKPESNTLPRDTYQYSFRQTAITPSQIAPDLASFESKDEDMPHAGLPPFPGQAKIDLIMRAKERELLSGKFPRVSKQTATRKPTSAIISEGTPWNGVNIAITQKTIDTTCLYVSEHAYFFVDNRNLDAMRVHMSSYGAAFDSIYATNHEKFGTEGDVDGYERVFIIFSQELESESGLLGYFYPGDKYSKDLRPDSNESDIFYLTTYPEYQGDIILGTLAHEFQHMIYFDQHYGSLFTFDWLNEALSQAAEYYNGYTATHHEWINWFLAGGWNYEIEGFSLSLTHWTSANYGYGAVFIRYLIDRFGDGAIKNMCSTPNVGIAAVEAATGTNFNTLFNDFARALVMSGTGDSTNPRYSFLNSINQLDLQAVQTAGRGGLITPYSYDIHLVEGQLTPYSLVFAAWTGTYATMTLVDKSGSGSIAGTVFGLSR